MILKLGLCWSNFHAITKLLVVHVILNSCLNLLVTRTRSRFNQAQRPLHDGVRQSGLKQDMYDFYKSNLEQRYIGEYLIKKGESKL